MARLSVRGNYMPANKCSSDMSTAFRPHPSAPYYFSSLRLRAVSSSFCKAIRRCVGFVLVGMNGNNDTISCDECQNHQQEHHRQQKSMEFFINGISSQGAALLHDRSNLQGAPRSFRNIFHNRDYTAALPFSMVHWDKFSVEWFTKYWCWDTQLFRGNF